jgi:hypothetical protein
LLLRRLDKALTRMGDLPSACFELLFEIGAGPKPLGNSSAASKAIVSTQELKGRLSQHFLT